MGFLSGKKILITGLLSNRSISYGIAQAAMREGASLAFTYANNDLKKRISKIAQEFKVETIYKCDVSEDSDIEDLVDKLDAEWGCLDGLVHSIAFAPREALKGDFVNSIDRKSFQIAHDISSYSLSAMAKETHRLMKNQKGASILTLTYEGSQKVFPNYNVMGLAKASLESNVRYLAQDLGKDDIRVNAISAGPIKTLAAAGIGGFSKILNVHERNSALRRNVTIEEVGNVAAFFLSDLSSGITGEVTYVDAGFNVSGFPFQS